MQAPVKELDEHCPLQAVEEEKTEEQKNVDKSRPVSSTPVPGTPWSVFSLCLFLSALLSLLSHRAVIVSFSPPSLSVSVITIYPCRLGSVSFYATGFCGGLLSDILIE